MRATSQLTISPPMICSCALFRPTEDNLVQNREALRLLYKAIELDPSFATAYGLAAWCYQVQTVFSIPLSNSVPLKKHYGSRLWLPSSVNVTLKPYGWQDAQLLLFPIRNMMALR